ncbi:transposase IS3/IS911 family protein [Burkholderia lata]|uniref:Transposase IS3/IS911 family protein n=1 Tax=Burkholderia lata (strain ATCC 17760 / DSM 23089 / LMG 22485 / NCIMB 9086 / R18194 / 383) TaxID=482957 RepID=A0A6P2T0U4_BURL3|nr:transposase [Burkholderia lata]VWC56766.1 transposase IS3/IS911 family protein [Burkholderia lata]
MDVIKQVESALAVAEICRELEISTATYYSWRGKYDDMYVPLIVRTTELEAENARLRKLYIEERIRAEILAEALANRS